MKHTFDDLYNMLKSLFYAKKEVSHSDIEINARMLVLAFTKNIDNTDEMINRLVSKFEENIGIKAFEPDILLGTNQNEKWFYDKKPKILAEYENSYFARYESFLQAQDFPQDVIQNIKINSERILSQCANPENLHLALEQKKKGLVVGDVQSGKTANYLGLINLACDYGYKTIIVLAGLTDSLRVQTQERIDEGFIGAKSNTLSNFEPEFTGVGLQRRNHFAIPLTNNDFDFAKYVSKNVNNTVNDYTKPVILVVKKNKSILTQVRELLKPGYINDYKNLLIIDDEADNASINVNNLDQEPSRINALIRDIFFNYENSTYIGFTATPFANVFINPDSDEKYKDLFPSDFIIQLNSPDNYFGGNKVFDKRSLVLREISENELSFLPVTHKKDYEYIGLATSLKEAIWTFLINNVIRTLRGHDKKHRTMMINMSSFNDVQEKIRHQVDRYIEYLKNIIDQTSYQSTEKFLRNADMKSIFDLYNTSFYENIRKMYDWNLIQSKLNLEVSRFSTAIINNKYKKKDRFSYNEYEEDGARVIVIGGFVLSRGLTLEGLMVSYFSRKSSAYDTMLQMCRWFGYRPKYEDLCRVYISGINIDNFEAVLFAIDDLKMQFREMQVLGKTPEEYSVMVRESPETLETTLLITSRNKFKNTKIIEKALNYGGSPIDTSKLFINEKDNNENYEAIKELIDELSESGKDIKLINNRYIIKDIPKRYIKKVLSKLKLPVENKKFNIDSLQDYLASTDRFENWDIVVATGNKENTKFNIGGFSIPKPQRKFYFREDEDFIRISGNNNRLVEPGIFNAGLTESQVQVVNKKLQSEKKKNPAREFLSVGGRNPLFVIYPLVIMSADKSEKGKELEECYSKIENNILGFGIGFPSYGDKVIIKYRVNTKLYNKVREEMEQENLEEDYDND